MRMVDIFGIWQTYTSEINMDDASWFANPVCRELSMRSDF